MTDHNRNHDPRKGHEHRSPERRIHDEHTRANAQRREQHRRQKQARQRTATVVLAAVVLVLAFLLIKGVMGNNGGKTASSTPTPQPTTAAAPGKEKSPSESSQAPAQTSSETASASQSSQAQGSESQASSQASSAQSSSAQASSAQSSSAQSSQAQSSSETAEAQPTDDGADLNTFLKDPFAGTAMPNANTGDYKQNAQGKGVNHNKAASVYAYSTEKVRAAAAGEGELVPGQKIAFLTYDDGPENASTPILLDELKKLGVPATFFMIGQKLDDSTAPLIRRMMREGHAIGLHSYDHDYDELYPDGVADVNEIMRQWQESDNALAKCVGDQVHASTWRYPGGHMSWDGLDAADAALKEKGVAWIDWNSTNGDADSEPETPEGQVEEVIKGWNAWGAPDVMVVLMHDKEDKEVTRESVGAIVKELRSLGFSFGILE